MMASPWCGFVGLNPLMTNVPFSPSAPLNWSNAAPFGEYEKDGSKRRVGGASASVHAATAATQTTIQARPVTRFPFLAHLDITPPFRLGLGRHNSGPMWRERHSGGVLGQTSDRMKTVVGTSLSQKSRSDRCASRATIYGLSATADSWRANARCC